MVRLRQRCRPLDRSGTAVTRAVVAAALLVVAAGCGGTAREATAGATVSVCVPDGEGEDDRFHVQVLQDGDVVGEASGTEGGAVGIEAPPGPVEVRLVDGTLLGEGDLGRGGSIAFGGEGCPPPPTSLQRADQEPDGP